MIDRIAFHAGNIPGGPPLEFQPPPLTIIVGPNSSGKTTALREIAALAAADPNQPPIARPKTVVVQSVALKQLSPEEVLTLMRALGTSEQDGRISLLGGQHIVAQVSFRYQDGRIDERDAAQPAVQRSLLRNFTVMLDGATRLNLVASNVFPGWRTPTRSSYWAQLLNDRTTLEDLEGLVAAAFSRYLVIDAVSQPGQVHPRLSQQPLPLRLRDVFTVEAVDFYAAAPHLSECSDGIKCYVGILGALMAGFNRLILLDEPDAFLHPPLSRAMGDHLARLATTRNATVVAATHDAHFLMGAARSGVDVAIVRLTHAKNQATARLLAPADFRSLMENPMLRATGVLDALFHETVVICEGHSDRVLYDEINARLQSRGRGIHDCLFLNAGNWQQVRNLIGPLRRVGIPAAAVVDLDAVRKPEFSDLMAVAGVPDATRHGCAQQAGDLRREVETNGGTLKENVAGFPSTAQMAVRDLIATLRQYGVFLVPVGELEQWLGYLRLAPSKSDFVTNALQALPADRSEVRNDDIWEFVDGIGDWVRRH